MSDVADETTLPDSAREEDRLGWRVIWAYAVPRIGFGIMGSLFGMYLMKFSTDVLLIAPAAMGGILFVSRLWDGVSDPVVGYLSDRTRARAGRRRSWMFAAAVPMAVGMVMIWSPPTVLDSLSLILWMTFAMLVYETASTAFFVPHGALGMELTRNYHERTRLFGNSHLIGAIGTLLGLVSLQLMNMAEDKRTFAFLLSVFSASAVAVIVLLSTRALPERAEFQGRGGKQVWSSFFDVVRNHHSRLLLMVFGIETFGAASVGILVPYLAEYVVLMTPVLVGLLLTYTIPQFAFTPMWIALARRVGKKKLWLGSMLGSAVFFLAFFFVTEGGPLVWVLSFGLGFAAGCGAVVAPSIQADVIDYDEYRTGERKEGAYLAVWNLVRKGAASATALVTGVGLQLSGFEPNVEQSETTQLVLRGLFGLLPAACYVVGAVLFTRFSLNELEHASIRRVLDQRSHANDADPDHPAA